MKNASIIPTLKYEDARAAIDWLCDVFGFEKHMVVGGEAGSVTHAQLTCGNGMIMLGSSGQGEFDALQTVPGKVGGIGTQSPYVIVQEIDAHYERAVAGGADIVIPIRDEDYGGRVYSCRDPEGHLWTFGNYDPWA